MWPSVDAVAWAERLGEAIARTHPSWLLAAVGLHLAGQVCRGLAWHGILRATWPECRHLRACAWHVCGAGLTGVLPARGGDVVRIGLARRELPGATWPVLAGTLVAEGSFEFVTGLLLLLVTVGIGVSAMPVPAPGAFAALAVFGLAAAALAARSSRVRRALGGVARGAAPLADPGYLVRRVLPYQAGGRVLRMGSMWCFLRAAGLPSAPAVVVAACAARGSGNTVPLPGANTATATAALLVALPLAAGHALDPGAITALAVVQTAVLTVIGVALSTLLLSRLLGARTVPALARSLRALTPAPRAASAR